MAAEVPSLITQWKMMLSKLSVLQTMLVMDMTGVGLVIPIMFELARSLGASPTAYGLSGTFYGIGQLLGAPIMGALSDQYGRKAILLLSLLNTSLFYGLMGFAPSFAFLLLCRASVGFGKQTMTAAQAYISDSTSNNERTAALGQMHAVVAVGFILGPILGSFLTKVSLRLPLNVASLLFLFNFLFVYKFLPDVPHSKPAPPSDQQQTENDKPDSSWKQFTSWLKSVSAAFSTPIIGNLLFVRVIEQMVTQIMQNVFLLYAQNQLDLHPSNNGFLLAYFGLIGVFTQMVFVPVLTSRFNETVLTLVASGGMALAYFAMAFVSSFNAFIFSLALLQLWHGVLSTCLTSSYTKAVPPHERGRYLGILASLESFVRVLIPTVAGVLLQSGNNVPFLVCGGTTLLISFLLSRFPPTVNINNASTE